MEVVEELNTLVGGQGAEHDGQGDDSTSQDRVALTEEERQQQIAKRTEVLEFLSEGEGNSAVANISAETKATILEAVTSEPAALDLGAVDMAINLTDSVLGGLLDGASAASAGAANQTTAEERASLRRNVTAKVGDVVSNVVLALLFVSETPVSTVAVPSAPAPSTAGGGGGGTTVAPWVEAEEAAARYSASVAQVYATVDLISQVQLADAEVGSPPAVLSTEAFTLVSQSVNLTAGVGSSTSAAMLAGDPDSSADTESGVVVSVPEVATSFGVPANLGPNFDPSAGPVALQLTEWSVDLHKGEMVPADDEEEGSNPARRGRRDEDTNHRAGPTMPYGTITGLKVRQAGDPVRVDNAGWFVITKNWTSEQAAVRAERLARARELVPTSAQEAFASSHQNRTNRTVARCNASNVDELWDVSCPGAPAGSGGGVYFHEPQAVADGTPGASPSPSSAAAPSASSDRSVHEQILERMVKCPAKTVTTLAVEVALSAVVLTLALLWVFALHADHKRHYYDDWAHMWLLGGTLNLVCHAIVLTTCAGESWLALHSALVAATIESGALLVVCAAFLVYLVPKRRIDCGCTKPGAHAVEARETAHYAKKHTFVWRKDKTTRYVDETAGPVETRTRFLHNVGPLLFLALAVLTPCFDATLGLLSEEGVRMTGSSPERADERPFLGEAELAEARARAAPQTPSIDIIVGRIDRSAGTLRCEDGDHFELILECPVLGPWTEGGGTAAVAATADDDACIFWDAAEKVWSGAGCELVASTPHQTVCRCNHLTDFGTALQDSVKVWERVFVSPEFMELFVVHWYAIVAIGVLLAGFVALAAYGHRYDALLERRSKMRGSLVALHVMGTMLAKMRNRRRSKEQRKSLGHSGGGGGAADTNKRAPRPSATAELSHAFASQGSIIDVFVPTPKARGGSGRGGAGGEKSARRVVTNEYVSSEGNAVGGGGGGGESKAEPEVLPTRNQQLQKRGNKQPAPLAVVVLEQKGEAALRPAALTPTRGAAAPALRDISHRPALADKFIHEAEGEARLWRRKSLWGFSTLPAAVRLQHGESFAQQRLNDKKVRRMSKKLKTQAKRKRKRRQSYDEQDEEEAVELATTGIAMDPKTGMYAVPTVCELFEARMIHEHDILQLYFVSDRWVTRVHRSVILLARIAIKVSVVGTFFVIKESTSGFGDQVLAIFLGFLANKICGGAIKAMFVVMASRRRAFVLNKYMTEARHARANPGQVPQHERRAIQRNILRLEMEREVEADQNWGMGKLGACCNARCCSRLPRRSAVFLDCMSGVVWLVAFGCIGFCLFFGVMFAFALDDAELARAWLDSVLGSIVFWVFMSRPGTILIKTLVTKCKLERQAKAAQERREQRHLARHRVLQKHRISLVAGPEGGEAPAPAVGGTIELTVMGGAAAVAAGAAPPGVSDYDSFVDDIVTPRGLDYLGEAVEAVSL